MRYFSNPVYGDANPSMMIIRIARRIAGAVSGSLILKEWILLTYPEIQ
jgi:hypothetical protein